MNKKKLFLEILIIFVLIILICPNYVSKNQNHKTKKIEMDNFIFGFNFKFIDGRFIVYKQPVTNPPLEGYPIIFLFHGASLHAFSWFLGFHTWSKAKTTFTKTALENGYFVVGLESKKPMRPGPRGWNSFEEHTSENYDIIYVQEVISFLENSSLRLDTNKIYCAGFSSGAFFCSRLAQSYGHRFRGVILNSGCNADAIEISKSGPDFNFTTGYNISSFHPPTLLVHGEKDSLVPIEGSETYYQDLKDNNINVTKLFDETGRHIWLKGFNNEIINWMKNH